jgi:hypothetical protein
MTTETRYRPWLCHHCGVVLDTVGVVRGEDAVPEQVDLAVAVCIGCGAPSRLDAGAWRPMRSDELAALTPAERRDIAEHQLALASARARGAVRDRSRDGGHA